MQHFLLLLVFCLVVLTVNAQKKANCCGDIKYYIAPKLLDETGVFKEMKPGICPEGTFATIETPSEAKCFLNSYTGSLEDVKIASYKGNARYGCNILKTNGDILQLAPDQPCPQVSELCQLPCDLRFRNL